MSNRITCIIAGILLTIMFLVAFFSILDDSLTFDETAHITAGYSYLTQKDYRVNPEHPPLVKDLAALPLLFFNPNFPKDLPVWTEENPAHWWEQFELASQFLYYSDNNPDKIALWSRIPMILILIFLGWFLFYWTKKEFGNKAALLVLTLFSFSPTFIAHGRLVTTDVAAALGVVLATCFWLKFLKNPNKKNIIFAGLILGTSMLLKFSLMLLVPSFAIVTIIYAILYKKSLLKYIGLAFLVGIIGVIFVIWPVYQFHISNYPAEKQLSDTIQILESSSMGSFKNLCIWMADKPGLRPFAHYFLGLLMATQRTAAGNAVYFMGVVSGTGWWYYFPVIYILKVPMAFHILALTALFWTAGWAIKKPFWIEPIKRANRWLLKHFIEFSMLIFLGIYWLISISGNLNIGVRHILPTFPFIYILVSLGIVKWIEGIKKTPFKKMAISFVSVSLGFYIISSLSCFPYYLSYFNEIGGTYKEGYKWAVDSNYDWGQDLKRLKKWVETNDIKKIKVDYFGGGNVEYYLQDRVEKFDPKSGPQKGWLAISINQLQAGAADPLPNFNQPAKYYQWLSQYQPLARVGTSIFIYYID